MTTATAKVTQEQAEAKPTISFANVIRLAPSTGSFGGWGPRVNTWN